MGPEADPPLLLYDGDCRFCRASARLVHKVDRRRELDLLSMHDRRAADYLSLVPEAGRYDSIHLIGGDGAVHSSGAAALGVLEMLSVTRWVAKILVAVRAERVVDALYRLVAHNRGRLGRFVPDGPGPVRFRER